MNPRELFRWPWSLNALWALVPFAAAIFVSNLQSIRPQDYWWHLAAGKHFGSTGEILSTNVWLYSMSTSEPFFNQPWLGQWLMYQTANVSHALTLVMLAAICVTMTAIVYRTLLKYVSSNLATIFFMLGFALTFPVVAVRTRMFAFIPFVVVGSILVERSRRPSDLAWKDVAVISVAIALWANLHGSFVVGIALFGMALTGTFVESFLTTHNVPKNWKVWFGGGIPAWVAGCFNPTGPLIYSYVAHLALESTVATTVTEWQPYRITDPEGALFLVVVSIVCVSLWIRRRSIDVAHVLMLLPLVYLAAGARRSMFFFAMFVPLLLAAAWRGAELGDEQEEPTSAAAGFAHAFAAGVLFVVALGMHPAVGPSEMLEQFKPVRTKGEGAGVLHTESSIGAVNRCLDAGCRRPFHDQAIGGLLGFRAVELNVPLAFVDQRLEFVPESVWEQYWLVSDAAPGWEQVVHRWEFDSYIVDAKTQPQLVQRLLRSDEFEIAFRDDVHVLFLPTRSLPTPIETTLPK